MKEIDRYKYKGWEVIIYYHQPSKKFSTSARHICSYNPAGDINHTFDKITDACEDIESQIDRFLSKSITNYAQLSAEIEKICVGDDEYSRSIDARTLAILLGRFTPDRLALKFQEDCLTN